VISFPSLRHLEKTFGIFRQSPYFFGFGFLDAGLPDFDTGGGGVFASRFTASVKLMFNLKSMAFGIVV